MKSEEILIVGCGKMGVEYAKALNHLDVPYLGIARSRSSAEAFTEATGRLCIAGGIERWLEQHKAPKRAIVAVNVELLSDVAIQLLRAGVKEILVEKPAGLDRDDIADLESVRQQFGAKVLVAYNRRFYPSVLKAKELIDADGGIESFTFEFTEWCDSIAKTKHDPAVKERWLLANSTHVIDLAFYVGGYPEKIDSFVGGGIEWHNHASKYVGAGVTQSGALFSYHANWDAPGRWGVEFFTKNYKLILRPMEALQVTRRNSVSVETVDIVEEGEGLKPGLVGEIEYFLGKRNDGFLPDLQEHIEHLHVYETIAGLRSGL